MMLTTQPNPFSRSQMISSCRRTRRWLSPLPPGRSHTASLSFMNQVKLRGVMPSAHFPRSLGGIGQGYSLVRGFVGPSAVETTFNRCRERRTDCP